MMSQLPIEPSVEIINVLLEDGPWFYRQIAGWYEVCICETDNTEDIKVGCTTASVATARTEVTLRNAKWKYAKIIAHQKPLSVTDLMKLRDQTNEHIRIGQAECLHEGVTKTPRADTGNYDPSADRYWYDCKCPTCFKTWTEDQ